MNINAQFVVDTLGQVGIGTETPKSLLSIGSNGSGDNAITCDFSGKKKGIHIVSPTSYYYYKGKQIPQTLNENKVCVSIPKDKGDVRKELLKDIQVLDTIRDDIFDISIIQKSDFKQLSVSTSWKKEAKSVLLFPSYRTKEGKEVF